MWVRIKADFLWGGLSRGGRVCRSSPFYSCLSALTAKTKSWTNNESIRTQRPSIQTRPTPLCGMRGVWGAPGQSHLQLWDVLVGTQRRSVTLSFNRKFWWFSTDWLAEVNTWSLIFHMLKKSKSQQKLWKCCPSWSLWQGRNRAHVRPHFLLTLRSCHRERLLLCHHLLWNITLLDDNALLQFRVKLKN